MINTKQKFSVIRKGDTNHKPQAGRTEFMATERAEKATEHLMDQKIRALKITNTCLTTREANLRNK